MARRRLEGLERVLGANALFSTAYGNVGSSIYYALGLVASYALEALQAASCHLEGDSRLVATRSLGAGVRRAQRTGGNAAGRPQLPAASA